MFRAMLPGAELAQDDSIAVLEPPTIERAPRRQPPKRQPPPTDPPDGFGGWGDGGSGHGGSGDGGSDGHWGSDGWRDDADDGEHTSSYDAEEAARFGLLLAMVGSSVMFAVFVAIYVLLVGGSGAHTQFDLPVSTWFATAAILASSSSLRRATNGAPGTGATRRWVGLTIVLGLAFLASQTWAWQAMVFDDLAPRRGASVTLFWMLTTLHAGHVVLGLVLLSRALRRTPKRGLLGLGATFWHFLGGLWLVMFLVLALAR